jgi:Fuc2NAc and GlcNAc transferase
MESLLILAVSVAGAWFSMCALVPLLRMRGVLDIPNNRSSHRVVTPRGGGTGIIVGMACGLVASWAVGQPLPRGELFVGVALVALIGFADDCGENVPVVARMTVQAVSAAVIVITAGGLPQMPLPPPLDVPLGRAGSLLAILWIITVTNIYNFLDGIDGFAGLQGVIAALGIALMAFLEGVWAVTALALAIAGGCVGFLAHNWHPARIFMGDVGSGTLGFLFAALPFEMPPADRGVAVFSTVLFLWFFLSDGTFTLLQRIKRGERPWEGHRSHLYQHLVKTGLRHDQVTLIVLVPGAVLAGLGLAVMYGNRTIGGWVVFAAAVLVFILYQRLTTTTVKARGR